MSPLAESLMRKGLDVIQSLVLPRLVPDDQLAALKHYERVFGEQAAKLESQLAHQKRRGAGKSR